MDKATLSTMEHKKLVHRSGQLSSKAQTPDRENGKKGGNGGKRRPQDWERDGNAGNSFAGGRPKPGNYSGYSASGGNRFPSKLARNKEKMGGQVRDRLNVSSLLDEEDRLSYDVYQSCRVRAGKQGRDAANEILGVVCRNGPNSRKCNGAGNGGGKFRQWNLESSKGPSKRTSIGVVNAVDKSRSFQARCQFVVNPWKEARELAKTLLPVGCAPVLPSAVPLELLMTSDDPDTLVSWDAVEEVLMTTTEVTPCPICLCDPVSPQITQCGHVYCYPCILHLFALRDGKSDDCPVCKVTIQRKDLRSFVNVIRPEYRAGSRIRMMLMKRQRHSMRASPVCPPPDFDPTVLLRRILADKNKVLSIVRRELAALEVLCAVEEHEPEACFIQQAIVLVKERECAVLTEYPDIVPGCSSSDANPASDACTSECNALSAAIADLSLNSGESSSSSISSPVCESLGEPCSVVADDGGRVLSPEKLLSPTESFKDSNSFASSASDANSPKEVYYFYQACDGSRKFLLSLNMAMLRNTYGSEENCPGVIEANIVEKTYFVMKPDKRERYKALRHLPLLGSFEMIELKLEPPLVSEEIALRFKTNLDHREQNRQGRVKFENSIEQRNLENEKREMEDRLFTRKYSACRRLNETMSGSSRASVHRGDNFEMRTGSASAGLPNNDEFPEINAKVLSKRITAVSSIPVTSDAPEQVSLSFAQRLMTPTTSTRVENPWPTLQRMERTSVDQHSVATNAWTNRGAKSSPTEAVGGRRSTLSQSAQEDELTFNAPDYSAAFSQALQCASDFPDMQTGVGGVKRKKNGKKSVIIFKTGMG